MDRSSSEVALAELVRRCPKFMTDERVDDFAIAELNYEDCATFFYHPFRFNGFMAIFCAEGECPVDVNLITFSLKKDNLLFFEPGNIIKFHLPSTKDVLDLRLYLVVASDSFIQEMARDLSRLYTSSVFVREDPLLVFPERFHDTIVGYYKLAEKLIESHVPDAKEAIHALANSAHSFFRSFWVKKMDDWKMTLGSRTARSQATVDRFIRLVTEHHMTEHYLQFYANELEITPKYLSKLVRDVTGRSAPDWIDSFLVLEAKNMLKYSDLAIKEIVFKLNFPDQSSFYKFFKLHTGMIPSEYRKS